MIKRNFTASTLALCLSVMLVNACFAQQIINTIPGDVVVVNVADQGDYIQWQESIDGNTWNDLAGKTASTLSYTVSALPIFLRAKINKPDCDIAFTSHVRVQRLLTVPKVTTDAVSDITSSSFLTGGSISDDGGSNITDKGVVCSTNTLPTLTDSKISAGNGKDSFTTFVEGLVANTTYYVRAYATNSTGTAYGNELTVTTLQTPDNVVLPTVTTNSVSAITSSSASCGGTITNDGGAPITGKGLVYSTSPLPTLSNNVVSAGTGNTPFQSSLTNLSPSTAYYVRAYATNSAGTAYGNQQTFSTIAQILLPVVSETSLSAITKSSVALSASVTQNGSISARGFVISTSPAPTTANSLNVAGTQQNPFTANATSLASGVRYYVRAFCTNEAGTAYGPETSFRTLDSNVILMFVPQIETYYSEYIVMRKALEASGYVVEVRTATTSPSSIYMLPANTTISATAATLPGGSHAQFTQQFQNLFNTAWDESLDSYPPTINVQGSIQEVQDMGPYRALVVAGGTGALAYRVDGSYQSQGAASAADVEATSLKLNSLALGALSTGKPVMAQCHAASLPVFWRVPGTSGPGAEALGHSLLKGQPATGYPDIETINTMGSLGVTYRGTNINDSDRITVASPGSSFEDNGYGDYKLITTRDWYPQTVAHAARTLINILESYPTKDQMAQARSILILHGGAVNTSNCSAANKANDIPCNYGNSTTELPADFTDLQSLLNDSPNDNYSFNVTQVNITGGSFPVAQQDILNYLDDYDAVIFYKHWSTGITNALLNAIVQYADNGGGVLALHHGLYNDLEGAQNKDILVNQLFGAASAPWQSLAEANRTTYRLFSTNYGHFISTFAVPLTATNSSLPAPAAWTTNPLSLKANASFSYYQNFQLYDELYNNMIFNPGVIFGRNVNEIVPMFSNDQMPSSQSHVSGFIKLFNISGSSIGRVGYLQAGERKEVYNLLSSYGQIIRNALIWVSQK